MSFDVSLYAFNQGEVSTAALGRTDIAKLRLAAQCQLNWAPWTLGPMMMRPGFIYIGEVLGDNPGHLMRFTFGTDDVALLELTANNLRIYVDEELVIRNAVATTVENGTFGSLTGWTETASANCSATINGVAAVLDCNTQGGSASISQTLSIASGDRGVAHGLRVVVTDGPISITIGSTNGASDLLNLMLDVGTHSLQFTPAGASAYLALTSTSLLGTQSATECQIEAAGAMVLPTTWAESDLPNLRYDQAGDEIFIACANQQQRVIERYAPGSWGLVLYEVPDGPFLTVPTIAANLTPEFNTADGTLTSDTNYFEAGHVGALFQLFQSGHDGFGLLGAQNQYGLVVTVTGAGTVQRNYTWSVSGTYSGKLSFQRSFDSAIAGFADITVGTNGQTGNSVFSSATGGISGSPDLDNVVVWERVGFEAGNFTSGYAEVNSDCSCSGGYGVGRVVSITSAKVANIEVTQAFASTIATTQWLESMWSGVQGWPTGVTFFDGRLYWFDGSFLWGSIADDFYSYAVQDQFGNPLGDDGAIIEQFDTLAGDVSSWGLPLANLMVGRDGVISSVYSSVLGDVITPSTITTKGCSSHGAAHLPAVKIDLDGLYVEKAGRRVFGLTPANNPTGYAPIDLTRLNLDIGLSGFVDIDVQREPDTYVHLPQSNGQMAVLLVDKSDEVACWWRIQTAGIIENVAVLPDPGFEDLVYCIVNRTINGTTRRFIERIAHRTSAIGGALNINVDCALTYSGSPITTAQASWLPNTSLMVWADGAYIGNVTTDGGGNFSMPDGEAHSNVAAGLGGAVIIGSALQTMPNDLAPNQVFDGGSNTLQVPAIYNGYPAEVFADPGETGKLVRISPPNGPLVVTNGLITLPNNWVASTIVACVGYVAPFMSAKLAYSQAPGVGLAQKKKIDHVGLLLTTTHTQAVQVGQRFDALDAMPLVEFDATLPPMVWQEYDAPLIELPGEWDTDARLCLMCQAPYPATISAAVIGLDTKVKA